MGRTKGVAEAIAEVRAARGQRRFFRELNRLSRLYGDDPQFAEFVIELSADEQPSVRGWAVSALGDLPAHLDRILPLLKRALHDVEVYNAHETVAEHALTAVHNLGPEAKPLIPDVQALFAHEADDRTESMSSIESCGKWCVEILIDLAGKEETARFLYDCFRERRSPPPEAAYRAYACWPDHMALPDFLTQHSDQEVRNAIQKLRDATTPDAEEYGAHHARYIFGEMRELLGSPAAYIVIIGANYESDPPALRRLKLRLQSGFPPTEAASEYKASIRPGYPDLATDAETAAKAIERRKITASTECSYYDFPFLGGVLVHVEVLQHRYC